MIAKLPSATRNMYVDGEWRALVVSPPSRREPIWQPVDERSCAEGIR